MSTVIGNHGGLKLKSGIFTGWLSKWAYRNLVIFPVPGLSVLLSKGFDPYQKGVKISPTPRHANMMLVSGPMTTELAKAASVAYAQMPRPRLLAFVDLETADPLPAPDVILSSDDLQQLTKHLGDINFRSENVDAYTPANIEAALEEKEEGSHDHKHHHHHEEEYESAGKDKGDEMMVHQGHGSHDTANKKKEGGHDHHDGSHEENATHDHQEKETDEKEEKEEHEAGNHSGHKGGHEGMGFMSMVAMTKDMPRSEDGLPMEMNEAFFGPFHPGLPGGLAIKITLDGDSVMNAGVENGLLCRHLLHHFPSDPNDLPLHLSKLNPLQPETYKALARKALADAAGQSDFQYHVSTLENERVISHLFWLAGMFMTLGDQRMHFKISGLIRELRKNFSPSTITSLVQKVKSRFYLQRRLRTIPSVPENLLHHLSGPVVRAAGQWKDERMQSAGYTDFEAVVIKENNAWGQLLVRMAEIEQSILLISGDNHKEEVMRDYSFPRGQQLEGKASIEAPGGKATLKLMVSEGQLKNIQLTTPSLALAALIPQLTQGQELADALVSIRALDISPWEIDQ